MRPAKAACSIVGMASMAEHRAERRPKTAVAHHPRTPGWSCAAAVGIALTCSACGGPTYSATVSCKDPSAATYDLGDLNLPSFPLGAVYAKKDGKLVYIETLQAPSSAAEAAVADQDISFMSRFELKTSMDMSEVIKAELSADVSSKLKLVLRGLKVLTQRVNYVTWVNSADVKDKLAMTMGQRTDEVFVVNQVTAGNSLEIKYENESLAEASARVVEVGGAKVKLRFQCQNVVKMWNGPMFYRTLRLNYDGSGFKALL